MQEVKVVRWCDECLRRDGVKEPARNSPRNVAIDGEQAEIDLCEKCDETYVDPLKVLLQAIGSRAQRPEAKAEDGDQDKRMTQCPLDGVWMDARSRVSHVENKHADLGRAGRIDWRWGEEIDEVWACQCGLTFPGQRGRDMHTRHKNRTSSCAVPENDQPVPARRPI